MSNNEKRKEFLEKLNDLNFRRIEDEMIANKWQTLIDCDYISLFIKTWFAFISSIKSIMEFTNEELIHGDSIILNKYKKSICAMIDNDMIELENENYTYPEFSLYKESLQFLPKILQFSTFNLFFKCNEKLNNIIKFNNKSYIAEMQVKNTNAKSLSMKIFIRKNNANYEFKDEIDKQIFKDLYNNYVKISKFNSEELSNLFCKCLHSHISDRISKFTSNLTLTKIIEKLNDALLRDNIELTNKIVKSFKTKKDCLIDEKKLLIIQKPVFLFEKFGFHEKMLYELQFKKTGSKIIDWEITFLQVIRNYLFHGIIDPFNKKWQTILKLSHETLKTLVDFNTKLFSSILRNKNAFNEK